MKLGEVVKVAVVTDLEETSHLYLITIALGNAMGNNALTGTRRADQLQICTGQKGP